MSQLRSASCRVHPNSFVLDEEQSISVSPDIPAGQPRWMVPVHQSNPYRALILIAGEAAHLPELRFEDSSTLFVRLATALPSISPDGLSVEFSFVSDQQGVEHVQESLLTLNFPQIGSAWRSVLVDLGWLAGRCGRLSVKCGAGPQGDPRGDWLAVAELAVAPDEQLGLTLARSTPKTRLRNELAHFSRLYLGTEAPQASATEKEAHRTEFPMGLNMDEPPLSADHEPQTPDFSLHASSGDGSAKPSQDVWDPTPDGSPPDTSPPCIDQSVKMLLPLPAEAAYDYAIRLLCDSTGITYPDYGLALKRMAKEGQTLRVLSLCCGTARMEAEMTRQAGVEVDWTLMDVNPALLTAALQRFSGLAPAHAWQANANELVPDAGQQWDVIMCVAALHHMVELESVMSFIAGSLTPGGEFWLIGEAVGPNGNRLWPEARRAADATFGRLPERYRRNAYTGIIDSVLPDRDYSIGTFEGIRSAEILPLLDRWFSSITVSRWNCFLWRLLDAAYASNFNTALAEDRHWIRQLVIAEILHHRLGGRGTELYGFYKSQPSCSLRG